MRHRLFNVCAALSALLFVIVTTAWLRGWFASDDLWATWRTPPQRMSTLRVHLGGEFAHVSWVHTRFRAPYRPAPAFDWSHAVYPPREQGINSWLWWDHYLDQPSNGDVHEVWRVQMRPWLPVIPTMILPVIWLRRSLARRRAWRQGRCVRCGYDLRATPDRCPECGAVPRGVDAAVNPS